MLKMINRYFIREKYGTFPQCDWITTERELIKGAKFKKTLLILKGTNFKLIRNIMHQMKSLRGSFIPP